VLFAKECLPKIFQDEGINDSSASSLSAISTNDVTIRQLCRLWGGKGYIYKITVQVGDENKGKQSFTFVMKHIAEPPGAYDTLPLGDRRKALSYHVEANFYRHLASDAVFHHNLVVPRPYLVVDGADDHKDADNSKEKNNTNGDIIICMSYLEGQDFDSAYYSYNPTRSRFRKPAHLALDWLATFHASHWDVITTHENDGTKTTSSSLEELIQSTGLQPIGSYWHLDTRPDEHASMARRGWEGRLKRAARAIDQCLKRDPMQCIIHGDPKSANIMLVKQSTAAASTEDNNTVAAFYDFQYCGKGSPTRDLAYFLCSSCDEDEEETLVSYYHERLVAQLQSNNKRLAEEKSLKRSLEIPTLDHLRDSLALAYCDFCRFMAGWGYWGYDIQDRVKTTLDRLDGGKDLGSEEGYHEAIRNEFW